ncbi:MAG: DUF3027 domain-containing protein [Nocardioidaceae bacterium]|nr:DUF3027 domain-containing protein [Nocardioidaceae bacterium]
MTTTKTRKVDAVLAAATNVARSALADSVADSDVGHHLAVVAEADRLATHYFASEQPGYRGWRWAVTVTRAPRQKVVTVNEITLLPGEGALVAPDWIPWRDRVSKHDLRPGDLHPRPVEDPRLVPGFLVGDEALDEATAREQRDVAGEVGLGRELVLSIDGRDAAAERWYAGDAGPDAPIAKAAPARCASCGFLVRMGGALSQAFGVCANAFSPSDGHAVSLDHGCGAHSDVAEDQSREQAGVGARRLLDTMAWDTVVDTDLEVIAR